METIHSINNWMYTGCQALGRWENRESCSQEMEMCLRRNTREVMVTCWWGGGVLKNEDKFQRQEECGTCFRHMKGTCKAKKYCLVHVLIYCLYSCKTILKLLPAIKENRKGGAVEKRKEWREGRETERGRQADKHSTGALRVRGSHECGQHLVGKRRQGEVFRRTATNQEGLRRRAMMGQWNWSGGAEPSCFKLEATDLGTD